MATARSTPASPYYPPRARWHGFLFRRADRLLWRFNLDPGAQWAETTETSVAAFLVPGLAFYLRGPRWLGKVTLVVCALLLVVFVVCLGQPAASWAAAALLSIHASGVLHRYRPLIGKSLPYRMSASVIATLLLLVGVYLPARFLIARFLVMPLTVDNHPLVVRTVFSRAALNRGDWVAYQLSSGNTDMILWESARLDVGQVVALPGDRVELSGRTLRVNGVVQEPFALLYGERSFVVEPGQWLVRPNVMVSANHAFSDPSIFTDTLLRNDLVSNSRMVGKPFQTWFGRHQTLP